MRAVIASRSGTHTPVVVLTLWVVFLSSCTTSPPSSDRPMDGEGETAALLSDYIDAIRGALRFWDWPALTQTASALQGLDTLDANDLFYRDYWRAAALFHAELIRHERDPESPSNEGYASLRDETLTAIKAVLAQRPDDSDSHAMLAALYGMTIRNQPMNALRLGPLWLRHQRAAGAGRSSNPRVSYLEGVGSVKRARDTQALAKALDTLLHAENLFERESQTSRASWEPDWGREHNWMFVGEVYEKLGEPAVAMEWFLRVIRAAPGLGRAKTGYERCRKKTENILL